MYPNIMFKWAQGKNSISLLEKEGGINSLKWKDNEEAIFYMPSTGGLIDISQHEILSRCIKECGQRIGEIEDECANINNIEKLKYNEIRVCKHCGRQYHEIESEATDKSDFCCIACELGI